VCEAVSVEKGARRPPLPTAVVCPPGRRRRRRLASKLSTPRSLRMGSTGSRALNSRGELGFTHIHPPPLLDAGYVYAAQRPRQHRGCACVCVCVCVYVYVCARVCQT